MLMFGKRNIQSSLTITPLGRRSICQKKGRTHHQQLTRLHCPLRTWIHMYIVPLACRDKFINFPTSRCTIWHCTLSFSTDSTVPIHGKFAQSTPWSQHCGHSADDIFIKKKKKNHPCLCISEPFYWQGFAKPVTLFCYWDYIQTN